ncbi:MAG: hypothetical protein WA063_03805 [Minisyncoccia bacterium]
MRIRMKILAVFLLAGAILLSGCVSDNGQSAIAPNPTQTQIEQTGSGDSNPGGNVGVSDDSDGVKVEGFNKEAIAYINSPDLVYSFKKEKTVYTYSANTGDVQTQMLVIVAKRDDLSKLKITYDGIEIKGIYYLSSQNGQNLEFWVDRFDLGRASISNVIYSDTLPLQKGKIFRANMNQMPIEKPLSEDDMKLFVQPTIKGENVEQQNPYYIIPIGIRNK